VASVEKSRPSLLAPSVAVGCEWVAAGPLVGPLANHFCAALLILVGTIELSNDDKSLIMVLIIV